MDALSLIVAALAAGLTTGFKESATSAVKDAYAALKNRLSQKSEDNQDLKIALAELERKPDSKGRQETLKEELDGAGVEKDDEILKLANEVLASVNTLSQRSKYNISLPHSRGVVIGDNSQVQQLFETPEANEE